MVKLKQIRLTLRKFNPKCKKFNRIPQILLAVGVCFSLVAAMVPNNGAFADSEPTTFVTSAKVNHWGRSDLRAYLNGVAKENNTLPLDTTHGTRLTSGYYESQFSDSEYALVQPFTYATNVLNSDKEATAVYETTDKFWLPSTTSNISDVISWAARDISSDAEFERVTASDRGRLIPFSYGCCTNSLTTWVRSPAVIADSCVLSAQRGATGASGVHGYSATAVAFKLDLNDVAFASAASANGIVDDANGGAKKLTIEGSSDFGKKTTSDLPSYGLYLKTAADATFTPTALTNNSGKLTVTYNGGAEGQYVVVQAFKDDDLTTATAHYCGAAKISSTTDGSTVEIDFSGESVGLTSFDGYTIKVWMEDGTASNLATATTPVTFYGGTDEISTSGTAAKNARVFAMKEDLQTSWGDLSELTDDAYNNVISGTGQNGEDDNTVHGVNPTNQKIYFGTDSSGNPLEFWIAGRETAANGGEIDEAGNVMTLYQAKSVETKQFNASTSNYEADQSAVTLQLEDGESAEYTGSTVTYTGTITFQQNSTDLETTPLKWQHRKIGTTAWSEGMPATGGKYEIRCYAEGTTSYERTYSANVNFTVTVPPPASEFTFIKPNNLIYDGNAKTATIQGPENVGKITTTYYDSNDSALQGAPINVGTYTVKINVEASDSYSAATNLTDESWKFEITKATPSYSVPTLAANDVYYGTILGSVYSAEQLGTKLGSPTLNDENISGTWSWADGDTHSTGNVGKKAFKAIFTPEAGIKNNYDWSSVDGWDSDGAVISVDVPIKVISLPINDDAKITLSESDFTYNGSAQKPTITVKKDTNTTLVEGTDYDIVWPDDMKNVGDKTVEITFKGNYRGTAETQYTIKPAEITPSITAENKEYDGTKNATVSVSFEELQNGETLTAGTDYEVAAEFNDANAGENKNVAATITLKNTEKVKNYVLSTNSAAATANISSKSITVTAYNQTKMEGAADPELTYATEGLIAGDSLAGNLERESGEVAGTYDINQGTLNNPNYDISFIKGTLTITAKPVDEPGDSGNGDEPTSDKSDWGTTAVHSGITHYVNADGMTSVEISDKNMDSNGIIWLKEESYGSSAWYGLDNSSKIFEEGSRFYVQWLNETEHPEAFEDIDEATRAEVESNNGWLFKVGVIKPNGERYENLTESVDFYVQIGDDWDKNDLEGFYISQAEDEKIVVKYSDKTYPDGNDEFGIMSLSHFSPYFIYDKLTAEEKAELDTLMEEIDSQQEEKSEAETEAKSEESKSDSSVKTGDEVIYLTISSLGLIMTLALGLMLTSNCFSKKRE